MYILKFKSFKKKELLVQKSRQYEVRIFKRGGFCRGGFCRGGEGALGGFV